MPVIQQIWCDYYLAWENHRCFSTYFKTVFLELQNMTTWLVFVNPVTWADSDVFLDSYCFAPLRCMCLWDSRSGSGSPGIPAAVDLITPKSHFAPDHD